MGDIRGDKKDMKKYRKKPIVIEAQQWFKMGDHPTVRNGLIWHKHGCNNCKSHAEHGLISTLEGEHHVCPGDWIIKGIKGELYPCKPDIFEATYDAVDQLVGDKT